MKLANFVKINTAEMNKDSRALFYSIVKEIFNDRISFIRSTTEDGEPKVTKMFHKVEDGQHWYIIPLKAAPMLEQMDQLAQKLTDKLNMGNFTLESSLIENQDVFNNSVDEDHFSVIAEQFAKKIHEDWMNERSNKGWRYGERRSDEDKTHPLMKNWEQLSESEKEIKPSLVRDFIKVLKDNGFKITRR